MSYTNREYWKVSGNEIVGYVKTNMVGSMTEFGICTLEEAEDLSDEELDKLALEAMLESGLIEWGY